MSWEILVVILVASLIFLPPAYRWHNRLERLRTLLNFQQGDTLTKIGMYPLNLQVIGPRWNRYLPRRKGDKAEIYVRAHNGEVRTALVMRCSLFEAGGPFRLMTLADYKGSWH